MKSFVLNIILFLLPIAILLTVAPFGLAGWFVKALYIELEGRKKQKNKNEGLRYPSDFMLKNSLSLDISDIVLNKSLFNFVLLQNDVTRIEFGNVRRSISRVLGLNAQRKTLSLLRTIIGKLLAFLGYNRKFLIFL
jgi:hypothetical protein